MEDNNYQVDRSAVIKHQEEQASQALSVIENKCDNSPSVFVKENYSNSKIRKSKNEPNFKMTLAVMLTKICALAGIKNEVDSFNVSDINKFILTACSDLSLEEIYKAFELERFGSYKEKTAHFNLFNAEYCASIIKKYRLWKLDIMKQHNISKPVNPNLPKITPDKQREIMDNALVRVFEEFKQLKSLPQPSNYIFDELVERGIIKLGVTEKLIAYYEATTEKAKRELQEELESQKKTTTDKLLNRSIKEQLEKIEKGNSESVYARVKKIVLTEYFQKLILKEIDIHQIITDNEKQTQNPPTQ